MSVTSPFTLNSVTISFQQDVDGYTGTVDTHIWSGLPDLDLGGYDYIKWYRVVDTNLKSGCDFLMPDYDVLLDPQDSYKISERSIVVLFGKRNPEI